MSDQNDPLASIKKKKADVQSTIRMSLQQEKRVRRGRWMGMTILISTWLVCMVVDIATRRWAQAFGDFVNVTLVSAAFWLNCTTTLRTVRDTRDTCGELFLHLDQIEKAIKEEE